MSEPIHIVDTTMFWSETGGGVRRYLLTKHDWLARRSGWRHTIAVPGGDPASDRARLPSLPLPGSGGYRLPLGRGAIARVLRDLEPDLIEAGDPYRVAWGALDAAHALAVPAVATCHSNLEAMARLAAGPRLGRFAARAARRYAGHVYRGFDLVLAPSRSMRSHLLDWGVERVALQPLGVDTAVFHPDRAAVTGWRAEVGLAADARVLVYAGRFAPEKHLDVLAEAVARLGPPHVLLAIGAGPVPPAGERVRVVPFVADVAALAAMLAGAEAFIHAGDQETFGLSALEAMACGTPIVVRKAEGLAELADGPCGLAVEQGTGAAFAEAIAALLAGDRPAQRRAARIRAEGNDWEQVFPALLGHYRLLLEGQTASPSPSAASGQRLEASSLPPTR